MERHQMDRGTYRVTFEPEGRSAFVLGGTNLVEAAGQAGIILNQPCGGEGTCGKCQVEVLENAPEPTAADRRHLSDAMLADGWRLACQLTVEHDLVVSIPQGTRFFEQLVLTDGEGRKYPFCPNLRKTHVLVPAASVEDPRSHLDRLKAAIGNRHLQTDLRLVKALPSLLGDGDGDVTVVCEGDEIQWVEAGDTTGDLYGVAFDIGTTTIAGALLNLSEPAKAGGQTVGSRTNPQVHFGDDVVTRIGYAEKHADGLDKLRKRLLGALNEIVGEVCASAGIDPEAIYEVTAVGNTTMSHIFLGVDPTSIGHAPYVTVLREGVDVKAKEVGLDINRNGNLHVLPNIAGFVGSDTVALVLASGMMQQGEVVLGIDIGTNGEVVLGNSERLIACSCAAGPAFEGARIRQGMRATEGAISKVVINEGIEVAVIGGGRASGICGSGLVDAVAELLNAGVIDPAGRILSGEELDASLPEAVREAVVEVDGQPAVVLAGAGRSKVGGPVVLTQRDVREVQLAKAAIQAGIQVIATEFGVNLQDVDSVLVAGGFGNFIRRSNAKRIGLLPAVGSDRIEYIGNAALTGAKIALACRDCREEAEQISSRTEYIELANRPDFQMHFMEAMMF
jgi:uncharacterized 2Fe-2S/4Fe-4S cluster protein (DUF4445 family)